MFFLEMALEISAERRYCMANIAEIFSAVDFYLMLEPFAAIIKQIIRFGAIFESAHIGPEVPEEVLPGKLLAS
jgi:hypothetical protein